MQSLSETFNPSSGEVIGENLEKSPVHSETGNSANDDPTRLETLRAYNLGQLLLRERECLFDQIYVQQNLNDKIRYFAKMSLLFSIVYGICLGSYSGLAQMAAAGIKIPLLLFLTLTVCAPALYTFNVLLGSKLTFKQIIAMLLIKTYLISLILISFAPIMLFFIVTSRQHDFTTLLNVIMCAIAGFFGISLLWKGMEHITLKSEEEPSQWILTMWIIIYMFVGTQLAWTLRPFVGAKGDFALFRDIEGNFYVYLMKLIGNYFRTYPYAP